MANSSLSAMYNWCSLCANTTIIAFQDENGFVQIGNSTSGGWTLTQLGQDLEPALGTGLALQPFYRTGQVDQVNLYYQKSFLNLSLASTDLGSTQGGWSTILHAPVILLIPHAQATAGISTHRVTTASHLAHPSPRRHLIPTSPPASKPGLKSFLSPPPALKSTPGQARSMIGWRSMCILRPWQTPPTIRKHSRA